MAFSKRYKLFPPKCNNNKRLLYCYLIRKKKKGRRRKRKEKNILAKLEKNGVPFSEGASDDERMSAQEPPTKG